MDEHEGSLPEITPFCVCSKCGSKVPWISRRCIAVEGKKGRAIFFGKPTELLNLCPKCLKKFYSSCQLEARARTDYVAERAAVSGDQRVTLEY